MINLQYHKGESCVCSSVFCQEGYCSGCQIYSDHLSRTEVKNPVSTVYRKEEVYSQEHRVPAISR
jgi:hypothetical protein